MCDVSTIRELFQIYFYGAQRNDAAILGNITYSDLLIMNIALVLYVWPIFQKMMSLIVLSIQIYQRNQSLIYKVNY